ncbi:MAG: hypothetical protein B6U87_02515 [Candidatus Aenigmarchaeota archaeon ex4484_52]|nr:MAG: hypothetical protein B6U87_02515 [Candidatus Aenigmarchaeota archaeon ex4484_52]
MSITFEYLKKLQENEQRNKYRLQKLNDDFYKELNDYVCKIKQNYMKEETQNINSIIKKIFELRLDKLIKIAKLSLNNQINIENATKLEKKFIDEIKIIILNYQKKINEKIYLEKKENDNKKKVLFREDVFSFVMDDMKIYGPYKKGEIKILDKKIIDLLLKNKKVCFAR